MNATGLSSRVLLIGSYCAPDSMEWHVRATLQEMGVDVQFFLAAPLLGGSHSTVRRVVQKLHSLTLREPERAFEKALVRAVQEFSPSLILVIMGNQVSPKTIERLRQHTRAPIVCWCQDQMTTLGRQYLLGAEYDAVFVKDRYLQDLFSRMIGSSVFHYLPEACNPQVHRPMALSSEQREHYACDVMIAGSLYYYRQEILQLLGEFDLRVWGRTPDWLIYRLPRIHMGRELVCDEKALAAGAARVSLNTLHYAEVDGLNCRAFELAGCGAFQLCTSKPVLAEHFEPGVEIETFSSSAELLEKIRHYLRNPDQAADIARRGQERAHREHTYTQRLQQLFNVVEKSVRVA